MSVVSTMATANSAPAFGQTLALTGSTLPSSTSEPTRPLTHRDTIDLAAAASLDALAARPRFAELAKSMRSLAGRIRLGVAVGKWDEETLSRADVPETIAHAQDTGEGPHRSPQNAEKEANADPALRSASINDMEMAVDDDESRASGSRVSRSGSDSEEEPLSSQHRTTKAFKTHPRSPEVSAPNLVPLSKRQRVTLIVKSPARRSPSPSSSAEDRTPSPPPRRTVSSPSPSDDGSDYDAARDPAHEFVCDVAGCGRTYKYAGAFWKHMARHEQETLLRDEAWGKISTTKKGRGGSAKRGSGMPRRGGGTSHRGGATARRGHGWTKVGRHRENEDGESDAESGPVYDDGLVRPFGCDYPGCGRAYTQSGSLHKHQNQKHGSTRAQRSAHEEEEEEEEEDSDVPSEPVRAVPSKLVRDVPSKPVRSLVCSCGREFKKANGLAIHRKATMHR
ncbi:uncharacterized protein SCHCODRAFT_02645544 [Schizophyllum commune H4-8]|uniref:uncharacterized protein n=1 Tax=Schizophyllum commune (strain H4-8 / FGSC 9210) TaxID=578458 RepID=UPI00215F5C24|nr:uncharacterized protein SCHCODRAFT_02645544 [Schizophyllum commune H4-8]KAI5884827.1 hypothetical protein SCHCODRAFT_02645544 [Schizophyllum commune H4-8]